MVEVEERLGQLDEAVAGLAQLDERLGLSAASDTCLVISCSRRFWSR